ncbi:disulfide bond formation protein B [Polycladidibacter stylochi]|uniref:disulfide bond formation protein B n=1 Tax=Polycladidibacter stylochi TaxID=1807766 RepID=UPI00082C8A7B|nr:disulfide bond formation protein B [Pseudovibrio stylochi]
MLKQMWSLVLRNPKASAALLVILGSAFSITMAWGFQLIGGYLPCELCLAQRVPYYVGVVLGLGALGFALTARFKWLATLCLLASVGFFIYGGGVGIYQAGAEWDWWLGPNDCGGGAAPQLGSAADMLKTLAHTRVVSCSTASIRILGLSFAGLNVFYSLGMSFVALCGVVLRPSAKA